MTTASARRELDFVASSLMPNTWQPLMAVTQLTMVILSWLSVSLEVFIRRDFGERYLNWLRLFLVKLLLLRLFVAQQRPRGWRGRTSCWCVRLGAVGV